MLFCFQIRHKFGCVDEIFDVEEQEVRHCNWVRFLQSTPNMNDVNIVGTRERGRPIFRVVKRIQPNDELKAYFELDKSVQKDEVVAKETLSLDDSPDKENLLLCRETLAVTPTPSPPSPKFSRTVVHSSPVSMTSGDSVSSGSPPGEYEDDRLSSIGASSSDTSPPFVVKLKTSAVGLHCVIWQKGKFCDIKKKQTNKETESVGSSKTLRKFWKRNRNYSRHRVTSKPYNTDI